MKSTALQAEVATFTEEADDGEYFMFQQCKYLGSCVQNGMLYILWGIYRSA